MDDVATSLVPRKRKRAGGGGGGEGEGEGDRPIAAKGERVMKFFQCTHDGPGRYHEGTLEALPEGLAILSHRVRRWRPGGARIGRVLGDLLVLEGRQEGPPSQRIRPG